MTPPMSCASRSYRADRRRDPTPINTMHRDDGSVAVFEGYRVQHHLTLGPAKGGTRFAPNVDLGEVAALAIWMSWKCALSGLPYGEPRAELRWIRGSSPGASWRRFPGATCRS